MIEYIGYLAAFCTTLAFAPQLLRAWRTRSTSDISLSMFLVLVTGVFLWLVYGMLKHDGPLVAANAVTFVLAGGILILKLRHK